MLQRANYCDRLLKLLITLAATNILGMLLKITRIMHLILSVKVSRFARINVPKSSQLCISVGTRHVLKTKTKLLIFFWCLPITTLSIIKPIGNFYKKLGSLSSKQFNFLVILLRKSSFIRNLDVEAINVISLKVFGKRTLNAFLVCSRVLFIYSVTEKYLTQSIHNL